MMLQAYFMMGVIAALANAWIMIHADNPPNDKTIGIQSLLMLLFWPVVVAVFWREGVRQNHPFTA